MYDVAVSEDLSRLAIRTEMMEHAMGKFDWVTFAGSKARFAGSIREPLDRSSPYALAVQTDEGPVYFGGFDTVYEPDQTHYSVEIGWFGYSTADNVGNPHLNARARFSVSEAEAIREIICRLILGDGEKPFPLDRPKHFTGEIRFRDGWIRSS